MSALVKKRLRDLRVSSIDLVDLGEANNARITLAKRRDVETETAATQPVAKENQMTLEQLCAELGPEKAKIITDALEAAGKKDAPPADPKADVMKELPPEVAKRLADLEVIEKRAIAEREAVAKAEREAIEKQRKALEEEVEKQRKVLAELQDAEVTREYVAKARKLERGVPGLSHIELADVMKRLDRGQSIPEETAKKLNASFAAMNELVAKSRAFDEVGSSGGGSKTGTAYTEIESIAKRYRDADPKLDKHEAIAKAAREHPELHARYRAEMNG